MIETISSTEKLQKLFESGMLFSIDVLLGKAVMVYIKGKQGYPRQFDSTEEAIDFLWNESGLNKQDGYN